MKNSERRQRQRERDEAMDKQLYDNFFDKEKKTKRRKNTRKGFLICLAILIFASVLNWGVITGWGNVDIDRITLTGADGAEFSALVYIPENATDETPAPAVIMFHGNAGNARNHESWAMEMARRGYVVISIDQFGAGDSEGYFDGGTTGPLSGESLIQEADLFYQYLLSMSIVDTDNIISTGHSMGSTAAALVGAYYNAKLIFCASPVIMMPDDEEYADYVEAWQNYTGNYVATLGEYEGVSEDQDQLDKRGIEGTWATNTEFGSVEEGNLYAFYLEHRTHEGAFVRQETIGHLIEYTQLATGDAVPNYIASSDQIWMYKDYIGLFGIFAFCAFVCALALLLIEEVPVFAGVKRPIGKNKGLRGIGLAISIALAVIFPYIVLKTDAFGLCGGSFYTTARALGFKLGYANMAFMAVVGISLLGIVGFCLYYFTEGRKRKFKFSTDAGFAPYGYENSKHKVKDIAKYILATLLLSAIVVAIAWAYIGLQEDTMGTSFYSWFFGIKEISINKIQYYWKYLIVWILCFVVSALGINVERRLPSTGRENLDIFLAIVFNIVCVTFTITVVVAVKWYLQTNGSDADTNIIWNMGLNTNRIWGMPVGMTVGIGGSTFLYKKTGNIWLSAILMGTIACLMCVTFGQTRFHYLTFYV